MKTAYDVILAPVLSEKAYAGFAEGKYTFWVHPKATKTEIKNAVETAFKVKVVKVIHFGDQVKQIMMNSSLKIFIINIIVIIKVKRPWIKILPRPRPRN